ncbi:MAG: hypothetical protein HFH14_10440 [Lachnospiraceae bacterium]|nr:hypothetical protein [Lachnospiraceae bacterium]
MKRICSNKFGIIAVLCMAAAVLIAVLNRANAVGAGKNVIAAVQDIKKGTVISEDNVDDMFCLNGVAEKEGVEYFNGTAALTGTIAAEDIPCGATVEAGMIMNEYAPISNIKDPVIMGIHAGEASQFVSGIIRRGDTINISVVDGMTDECESVLADVYVCGAYNDDGSSIEDGEGSAKSLNILVEREDETRINALLHKGIIRISKTGCGLND